MASAVLSDKSQETVHPPWGGISLLKKGGYHMGSLKEVSAVAGSIIQRSIIPRELSTTLNITAITASESSQYVDSLKALTTQIFGIAANDIIDENEYSRSLEILRGPGFWDELESLYHKFYGHRFGILINDWYYGLRRWREDSWVKGEGKHTLAEDILISQLSAADIPNVFGAWPYYQLPFLPISPRYPHEMSLEFLSRYDIRPEALAIAIRVRYTAAFSSKKVMSAVRSAYQYHIPSGQSPKTTSDTLLNIIKSARSTVVAPLIAGALGSATLISTGQYLLAIECAGASSGATLFLVATTSLIDYIVSYISKQRGRLEEQDKGQV